jgi:hypothetical protein
VGKLVLEREGSAAEEGVGEARAEVGEGGVAVDDDDAGLTAHVAEGFVVGEGDDVAAVAAHESELGTWDRGERLVEPAGFCVAGARGGVD